MSTSLKGNSFPTTEGELNEVLEEKSKKKNE